MKEKWLSRKLWISVVAFFAPILTQYLTGAIGWDDALKLSALSAIAYCVAQGATDVAKAGAAGKVASAEALAARPTAPPPTIVVPPPAPPLVLPPPIPMPAPASAMVWEPDDPV